MRKFRRLVWSVVAIVGAAHIACVPAAIGDSPYYAYFFGEDVTDRTLLETIKGHQKLRHIKFQSVSNVSDAAYANLALLKELQIADFFKSPVGAPALKALSKLPDLTDVNMVLCVVSQEGLKYLSRSNVKKLDLRETETGDTAAWYASYIPGLEHLDMSNTQITDAGVGHLVRATKLRFLYLLHTPISNAAAGTLLKIPTLELLDVRETGIGDAGLQLIARLPRLNKLLASSSSVTDSGLEALAGNPRIQLLDLSGSNVTDKTLTILATMPKLKHVTIYRTAVTNAALSVFKQRRPDISILGPEASQQR